MVQASQLNFEVNNAFEEAFSQAPTMWGGFSLKGNIPLFFVMGTLDTQVSNDMLDEHYEVWREDT